MLFKPDEIERSSSESKSESSYLFFQPKRDVRSRAGRLAVSAALLAKPLTARRSGGYPGRSCSLIKSSFKVLRTQIAQRRVPAGSIVIAFDVSEGFGSRLLQVSKRALLEQFRLVARKQALRVCVVIGFIGASHTLFKAMLFEQISQLGVHVLSAAIGVNDQTSRQLLADDGFFERLDDQFRRHRTGDLPTQDVA